VVLFIFDFLKGGKATVSLELDLPNAAYAPGEVIHARVIVRGEKDLKIQKGHIALVAREEYERQYQDRERDSDGDYRDVEVKRWLTDEQNVWNNQFLGETTIRGGSDQSFQFDIPIPPDAPPTLQGGKILKLNWLLKATLDRKMASDVEAKTDVYIHQYPTGQSAATAVSGASSDPGDVELALSLSNKEFTLGETVSGEFNVRPVKEFDVTEIRVELRRLESVPEALGNQSTDTRSVKISGGVKLKPGQDQKYPFQISIPDSVPITANTRHGTISWALFGVLARRLRADTTVTRQIFVFHTRPK
jgi:sporulation-control protein spo0M